MAQTRMWWLDVGEWRGPFLAILCENAGAAEFQKAKNLSSRVLDEKPSLDFTHTGGTNASLDPALMDHVGQILRSERVWFRGVIYVMARFDGGGVYAVGVGSNKEKCTRAAHLALAVSVALRDDCPPVAKEEVPSVLIDEAIAASVIGYASAASPSLTRNSEGVSEPNTLSPLALPMAGSASVGPTTSIPADRPLPLFPADDPSVICPAAVAPTASIPGVRPLPLLPADVESLRAVGLTRSRKEAWKKQREYKDIMIQELRCSPRRRIVRRDLTKGDWPWQHWIAGMNNERRNEAVGTGVKSIFLEVDQRVRNPFNFREPQINFVLVHLDGTRVLIHAHENKYERFRHLDVEGNEVVSDSDTPTRRDVIRAFRMATEWACRNRWQWGRRCVFTKGIVDNFLGQFGKSASELRSDDLQRSGQWTKVWELSEPQKLEFCGWLATRDWDQHQYDASDEGEKGMSRPQSRSRCLPRSRSLSRSPSQGSQSDEDEIDPARVLQVVFQEDAFCSDSDPLSVQEVCRASGRLIAEGTVEEEPREDDDTMEQSREGPAVEDKYVMKEAYEDELYVSEIRYLQDDIAKTFSDGRDFESLIEGLVTGEIPLTARFLRLQVFYWPGRGYYSRNNRRLHCLKTSAQRMRKNIKVHVEVFELPEAFCEAVTASPFLLTFMRHFSTHNDGNSIRIGRRRRLGR